MAEVPVSYTHLDVYKRQVLGEMVPFDELKFLDTTALFTYQPVSRS